MLCDGLVRRLTAALDERPDHELLARFAETRDEAAFTTIVHRHGPLVLGVCRRALRNEADADDAFQAVFLVLARKANVIRPPGSVGSWLYGVAVRTARKAKVAAARRWRREMASAMAAANPVSASPDREVGGSLERAELRAIIDDELGRLSADLRAAVVLCDLGGKSRAQAARELGCPEGTIAARLYRARKLLADRLTRRGVALPATGIGAVLSPEAVAAAVSPDLARTTLAAAELFATGTAGPAVSPAAQALAEGMIRTMSTGKFKLMLVAVLAAGLMTGAGALWGASVLIPPAATGGLLPTPAAEKPAAPPKPPAAAAGPWREKAVLKDIDGPVTSVAFAWDDKTFAAGGPGIVMAWDAESVKKLWDHTFRAAGLPQPAGVAYSPGGAVAGTHPGGVTLLDAATGRQLREIEEKGATPRAVAFGPITDVQGHKQHRLALTDGRSVWAKTWIDGGEPGTAQFGPLAGAPKIDGTPPVGVVYSPLGKRLVFIPNYKVDPNQPFGKPDPAKATHWIAQVWGGGSGAPMMVLPHGTAPVTAVAWSPDGKLIATGGKDGMVILWDAATGKEVGRAEPGGRGRKNAVRALAFAPDGKTLAAATDFKLGKSLGWVVLLDVSNGKRVQVLDAFTAPPVALAFSPDGKTLVVGCGDPEADQRKLTPDQRKKAGEVRVFTTEPGR